VSPLNIRIVPSNRPISRSTLSSQPASQTEKRYTKTYI
jgi:hypothetical protein